MNKCDIASASFSIVKDEHRKMLNDGLKPTTVTLIERALERIGRNEPAKVKRMNLLSFIDKFIEDSKSVHFILNI